MSFNIEKYKIELVSLIKGKKLGKGTFGGVYSGTWSGRGGGIDIVYKKIDLNDPFIPEKHLKEFELMFMSPHPHVLQVYGYAVSDDLETLYIVMERMDEDLLRYLLRKKLNLLEKVDLMILMTSRDIKSKNFLLRNRKKDEIELKICDFGFAKAMLSTHLSSEGGRGTKLWMAPELFKGGKVLYTEGSDVYALAMTFFEVLNETLPFFHENKAGLVNAKNAVSVHDFVKSPDGKAEGNRPKFKKDVPKELVEFLGRCWCNDPEKRLSTQKILDWLIDFKEDLILASKNAQPLPSFAMSNQARRGGGGGGRGRSPKNEVLRKLNEAHNCLWGLNGERIDYYKPHKLYEEIVNCGGKLDANANFNLGWMYEYGFGVTEDETKSEEYYTKAAEFYSTKKVEDLKPIDWANMGYMYVFGWGFEENKKKGIKLLKKAVERGNLLAMWNLGGCYQFGIGVEMSDTEAFKLFSKAAEMGLPIAMNHLGYMYDNGYGVKQDEKKALALYREAAEKGHRAAMYNVGVYYKNGWGGVEKNLEEAKKWYKMAAELGSEEAGEALESIAS